MRVLVVEDNRRLSASLRKSLEEDGYAVDAAYDGEEGEAFALSAPYDVILLDVMLPQKDGFELCRDLRRGGINAPILMLTARDAIDDRVDGLDSGADDYLVKPFSMNELRARLRALLRRNKPEKSALEATKLNFVRTSLMFPSPTKILLYTSSNVLLPLTFPHCFAISGLEPPISS